jgi:hypothetical protein
MLTINKPLSASEAAQARNRKPWKGWFPAEFLDAVAKESSKGNSMIEARLAVHHDGETREFLDWFTASERFAEKLRHACEACGALDAYEAGRIAPEIFPGHAVEVRLDVEKRRGYPDRSVIVDYRASASEVVTSLRRAG